MTVEFKDFIELVKAVAWPVVVAVALFAFRKTLTGLVAELGRRARKLSAFEISVEFAKIPSPPPAPWTDPAITESHKLTGGNVSSTTIMELFQRMKDDQPWHYLVVDIGGGKTWLISRVFLFTVILHYLRGLKCVVFVETKDESSKRFLGLLKPEAVRVTLARKYPWLDQALVAAWSAQQGPVLSESLSKSKAQAIVNAFMKDTRIQEPQAPPTKDEWEPLESSPVWEHTKWLDFQRVNEDLRQAFPDRDSSQLVDSPDATAVKRNRAILCRQTPFVALVNDRGEFKALVDRQGFLEKVASRLTDEPEDDEVSTG